MPNAARVYGFPEPPVPEVDGFLVPGETLQVGKIVFGIRLTDVISAQERVKKLR